MKPATFIQYHGLPGITEACLKAVMRLIQFGDKISEARILTCSEKHALLLKVNGYEDIAVKTGFASGYGGEGPRSFAVALQLLHACGVAIEEYEVSQAILERIDTSSLSRADIEALGAMKPVSPIRWFDYVWDVLWQDPHRGWQMVPHVMPFAIIDPRIMDLAISFFDDPDKSLLTGYRRLEDIVRERTGLDEHGQRLFTQAFQDKPKLAWPGIQLSERTGRVSLFTGVFMAYRNPRGHREIGERDDYHLAEFLLLNHLYRLEQDAVEAEQAE